jgi:adenine-specific DNA-methyltransferase
VPARATLAERRKIGAYYTPATVTDALAEWAIRSAADLVLEPGFGGCGFLESSANRLKALGASEPSTRLHGCDIDDHAFRVLHSRLGLTQLRGHFVLGDFMALDRKAFANKLFDVALGNPPYIRHHHIVGEQKALVRALRDRALPSLNLQASLWAYFVLHACNFLKVGGRVAWLLPSSFMHAYYATTLRAFLNSRFAEVRIIVVDERLFESEGAAESSVVVVAEGWGETAAVGSALQTFRAQSVAELRSLLSGTQETPAASVPSDVFDQLAVNARPLGDFCKLSIGIVTGDADFFLFDRQKAKLHSIAETQLTPIVSKARLIPGLSVTTGDLRRSYSKGAPSMILDTRRRRSHATDTYLATMTKKRIKANLTFNKREIWHRPLDGTETHAFFTSMSHFGPRLVLNATDGATCTNTLYRATFKKAVNATERRVLSISLISSFGQLSSERHGRSYGAGMLKHEPSEAHRIRLLVPSATVPAVTVAFKRIDALLRAGAEKKARLEADRFMVSTGALTERQCRAVRLALDRARALRWQHRVGK